jgi:hypothetical protein
VFVMRNPAASVALFGKEGTVSLPPRSYELRHIRWLETLRALNPNGGAVRLDLPVPAVPMPPPWTAQLADKGS